MIDHLGTVGYMGARAGIKGVNAPDFPDPLREEFDVYNDENSIYYPQFSDVNKAYVDDAIAKGGWAIRELHGIEDTTWEAIPTADYLAHLDYVKGKVDSNELWVDTPSTVSHYRFARQYCSLPTVAWQHAELRRTERAVHRQRDGAQRDSHHRGGCAERERDASRETADQ